MASGKQTEGFRGEGGGRGASLVWVLRRACIARSTGCYMQTVNHGTLHEKLMTYCMVTNTT